MKRKTVSIIIAVVLCFALSACSAKLVNVRSSDIILIEVHDLINGYMVEIDDPTRKIEIIEELDQQFNASGECTADDGHKYQVVMFSSDEMKANIIINGDGSVCKDRTHYIPASGSYFINVSRYDDMFRGMPERKKHDGKPYTPDNIERGHSDVLLETEDWTYLCENVVMEERNYTVISRERPDDSELNEYQVLFSIKEPYGNKYKFTAEYILESAEQSKKTMEDEEDGSEERMYFSVTDTETNKKSLHSFSVKSEYFETILESPCSNMIIFEDPPNALLGYGWVVIDNAVKTIRLCTGKTFDGMSRTIEQLDGMPDINEYFFSGSKEYMLKYTELEIIENGVIKINVIETNNLSFPEKKITSYEYDCLMSKLIVPEEEDSKPA